MKRREWSLLIRREPSYDRVRWEVGPLGAIVLGVLIAALIVFAAPHALGDVNDPGSGCNGEAAPGPDCRPDPGPGQDCEEHGNNGDGNEDHCTSPSPTPSPTVDPTPTVEPTPTPTITPTPPVEPTPTPSTPTVDVPRHPKPGLAKTGLSALWNLWATSVALLLVGAGLTLRRRCR